MNPTVPVVQTKPPSGPTAQPVQIKSQPVAKPQPEVNNPVQPLSKNVQFNNQVLNQPKPTPTAPANLTIPVVQTKPLAPATLSGSTAQPVQIKSPPVAQPQPVVNDPLQTHTKKVQFNNQVVNQPEPTITTVTKKTVAEEKDFDWDLDDGGSGMRQSFYADPAGTSSKIQFNPPVPDARNWRILVFEKLLRETETS